MRAVVTRVKEASVVIEGNVTGKIGQGFLILLGIGPEDTEAIADKMAEKICNCRVFEDENGKMKNCRARGFAVEHGEFGADMQVHSVNDGPVTLLFDSAEM